MKSLTSTIAVWKSKKYFSAAPIVKEIIAGASHGDNIPAVTVEVKKTER